MRAFRIAADKGRKRIPTGIFTLPVFVLHRPPDRASIPWPRTPAAIKIRPCTAGQSQRPGALFMSVNGFGRPCYLVVAGARRAGVAQSSLPSRRRAGHAGCRNEGRDGARGDWLFLEGRGRHLFLSKAGLVVGFWLCFVS